MKTLPDTKAPAVAEKHPGGRPTKYKAEYAKKMLQHFKVEPYKREVIESRKEYFKDGEVKSESEKFRLTPNKMPTFFSFAESINVDVDTLRNWCDEHEEFFGAYTRAKDLQKEWLIANGLSGAANPQFAIFTAKNVTDMRDKVDVENTVNHQVFFVPREIAEKHGLQLPEGDRPAPIHIEAQVIERTDPAADPT